MAINFAGGTDRLSFGSDYEAIGCCAFWMKTTQITATVAVLSVWGSSSLNGFGFPLNYAPDANKLRAVGFDASGVQRLNLVSTTTVNDGNWHHIAYNWNSNNGGANSFYIDGALEASGNSSAAWTVSPVRKLCMGDDFNGAWAPFVGDLGEVALWNVQLDSAEIAALAKGFSPLVVKQAETANSHFYAPLVRDAHNRVDGYLGSQIGTTVSDHPRIIGGTV